MNIDTIRLDLLVAILDGDHTLTQHLFNAWVALINITALTEAGQ